MKRRCASLATALWVLVAASLAAAVAGILLVAALPDLPPAPLHEVRIQAEAVATIDGTVTSRRRGRLHSLRCSPGDAVAAGDPLLEFEDLGLAESKSELDHEIRALRAAAASAVPSKLDEARSGAMEVRRAAVRQLEESYELARKDFERWKILHEGGLVARLDFERKEQEFAALGARLEEARDRAVPAHGTEVELAEAPVSPELRRTERLRRRLEQLPTTFVVKSPWDGTVRELHVSPDETPPRGAALATIARVALSRLEADASSLGPVVSLRSACGIPGPFPFDIRMGVLSLTAPDPGIRPGDQCEVVVWTRK